MNSQDSDSLLERRLRRDLEELPQELWNLPSNLDDLEQRVVAATGRVVSRRRNVRRLGACALAAGLYGMGFWTAQGLGSSAPPTTDRVAQAEPRLSEQTPPRDSQVPTTVQPTNAATPPSLAPLQAADVEARARRGGRNRRAERWKQAGDLFLNQQGSVEDALRCYRKHIVALGPDGLTQHDSDTWLLAQLKTRKL